MKDYPRGYYLVMNSTIGGVKDKDGNNKPKGRPINIKEQNGTNEEGNTPSARTMDPGLS